MKYRLFVAVCVTLLATVAAIEGALRIADPLGLWRYYQDLSHLLDSAIPDTRGYAFAAGVHQLERWQMTILPDTSRRVPDTDSTASCVVALVGDSVTQATGVNDDETWANLIARELPAVRIINTGVLGYNVRQVAATIHRFEARGYVYLMIYNDDQVDLDLNARQRVPFALQSYVEFLRSPSAWSQYRRLSDFAQRLDDVLNTPNLVAVTFDTSPGMDASKYPQVRSIPAYKGRISQADTHANAEGNREIAKSMLPIVRELAARVCG